MNSQRRTRSELAIDGKEKILLKTKPEDTPLKRTRKLPQRAVRKPYSRGWLVITDPATGRLLSVEYMHEPENNHVK